MLIAHNKETGETGAVAGLKEDGTPAMADTKTSKLSDLVVFNLHKNPLEAFMSNFLRQCKNPSKFGFYKLDAENLNTVGPVMQDALKDPEANKAMLDPSKVEVKAENRNYHKIDADKIDWNTLKSGQPIKDKQITDRNGKQYTVTLQVNADSRRVEFVPDEKKQRQSQNQGESNEKTPRQSTWLTKDGKIRPITKWDGVPMTEQQQADYVAGKTVVMSNMVDKEGKPCTVYQTFNPKSQRPNTSFTDPRQAQSVTPANESKTQMAVNNEGKTNEATKKIKEPLQKGQTEPKDDTQKRKSRGMKM